MHLPRRLAALSAALVLAIAPAQAVTVYYSATIDTVAPGLAPLGLIGEVVSGSFTYNVVSTDTNALANEGTYTSAVTAGAVTLASFSDTLNAGTIFTGNNVFNGIHTIDFLTFAADIHAVSSTYVNVHAYRLDLTLSSTDLGVLTNDDLPTPGNFPGLGDLSSATVRLQFTTSNLSGLGAATGQITYLSLAPPQQPTAPGVPDGGAVAGMLALALGGLAAARRKLVRG